MLYFPQLVTGAMGQYPLAQRRVRRTVVNRSLDGGDVKLADAMGSLTEWELSYQGISAQEWNAIEMLFDGAEGRLNNFVFVDPGDNLLQWSEDLSAAAWTRDPMIQLTSGVADPLGTGRANRVVNTGQAAQQVTQTIGAPAGLQYCLSLYARGDGGGQVGLIRGSAVELCGVTPAWRRLMSSGTLVSSAESIGFGLEVPAGGAVDVFGWQVEAQVAPSGYKKTLARSGVYGKARFQQDSLTAIAHGPDQYSVVVRISSRE